MTENSGEIDAPPQLVHLAEPKAERTVPHPGIAFALGVIGYFMITVDITIVSVALPVISHSLGFSNSSLSWITTAFTLTYAGCMMLGGRVVDLFGRKRSFLLGLALFTVASLGSALAPDAAALLVCRAVQGVGAAITTPCMLALILDLYPDGMRRQRALGLFQSVIGSGAAAGLLLGGLLTDTLGWRWLFLVNVPVGAVVLVLAPRFLPRTVGATRGRRFDARGALIVTAALVLLIYSLSETANHGWLSVATSGGIVGAILLGLLFAWNEQHSPDPLLPLHLPRNPVVYTANLRALLVSGVFLAALVLLALDDEQVLGHSPIRAGLSILPAALMILALGRLGPRIVAKIGIRRSALFAPLVLAAGMIWFSLAPANDFLLSRLLPDLLIGFGATVANLANMLSATSIARPTERGAISGLQYTAQQTGQSSALAALTAAAATYTASQIARQPSLNHLTALHDGYRFAFFAAGIAAVVSAALALPPRAFARD